MLGLPLHSDLDSAPIPLTAPQISAVSADGSKAEHVSMEFWGVVSAHNEGNSGSTALNNNTYKSTRVIGPAYNLLYTVWCDGSHELYDMNADPYQMNNLVGNHSTLLQPSLLLPPLLLLITRAHPHPARAPPPSPMLFLDIPQLTARLDTLMMVLKSCTTGACRNPWGVLHPQGNVHNLRDALASQYDVLYASQPKVSFSQCKPGYLIEVEGPQDVIPYSG